MLSAFSFGKIIKTFLPGSLLSAALLLVAEALVRVLGGQSLVPIIANKDVIVATTAALLPLTLVLGFVLNTVVWFAINGWMPALVRWRLRKSTAHAALQSALLHRLRVGLKRVAPALDGVDPGLESLEYFYLPVVTLERHNQLWESYFSWYEFQTNTALATVLLAAALVFYLLVMQPCHETIACVLVIVVSIAGAVMLLAAAAGNLFQYQLKLPVLIAGALEFQQPVQALNTQNALNAYLPALP
jgi:hypothetical protein